MQIPETSYDAIRTINVNRYKVTCDFRYWREQFDDAPIMLKRVQSVEACLGTEFGRSEVVDFYKSGADIETKFLAAMIWGHQAPANSRRDTRGPWKVDQMFKSLADSRDLLAHVRVDTDRNIEAAYRSLKTTIHRCGPSFFSKHLYFLGKSKDALSYPLIYDDRVAQGLARLSLPDHTMTGLVTIHAKPNPKAYLAYLGFARIQAKLIRCELDQIEYFLFLSDRVEGLAS